MPSTFRLENPSSIGACGHPFGVRSMGVPAFECLRLLTGSLNIQQQISQQTVKLRYCHLSQKTRRLSETTIDKTIQLAFDGDLSIADVNLYLSKSAGVNREFWEELRSELCFCLFARQRKSHVESFLHMYRILELISVAVPLIYAAKIADFRKAVDFIKSLSKNERDQDLAILRYFSEEVSKSGALSGLSIDYPFIALNLPERRHLRTQINSYVLNDRKIIHNDLTEDSADGVSIEFKSVSSFTVSCRNRLFHNAISNENFKLDVMQGADPLCSILVGPGLYWFSFVLTEILKAEASRYV
jgi:hypothetical protein